MNTKHFVVLIIRSHILIGVFCDTIVATPKSIKQLYGFVENLVKLLRLIGRDQQPLSSIAILVKKLKHTFLSLRYRVVNYLMRKQHYQWIYMHGLVHIIGHLNILVVLHRSWYLIT